MPNQSLQTFFQLQQPPSAAAADDDGDEVMLHAFRYVAMCAQVRTLAEQHLGVLGPSIRAEVGDTVHVVFRNTVRFPTSIHVHGLLYNKRSEGSPYADGTSGEKTKFHGPRAFCNVISELIASRGPPL